MPTVSVNGVGDIVCAEGRRLVLGLEDAGIDILHRCGGNARCATCLVEIVDGTPSPITPAEEQRLAQISERTESTRLSCQIQVRTDLSIEIARRLSDSPELGDAGPRPIEWPLDRPLPPE